eukprot:scaffold1042_cov401-Prasinococcus_capsulatus_cf.AAC.27
MRGRGKIWPFYAHEAPRPPPHRLFRSLLIGLALTAVRPRAQLRRATSPRRAGACALEPRCLARRFAPGALPTSHDRAAAASWPRVRLPRTCRLGGSVRGAPSPCAGWVGRAVTRAVTRRVSTSTSVVGSHGRVHGHSHAIRKESRVSLTP